MKRPKIKFGRKKRSFTAFGVFTNRKIKSGKNKGKSAIMGMW